ncbi:DUF2239 family protein [Deinococcus navajonensis]|uniref:DUF2239 family protein n=1 Tax=Deinococcus navajonensis TaxID=309884 RepID=A0ABV8XSS3_9DEIO
MDETTSYTAFQGARRLVTGSRREVLTFLKTQPPVGSGLLVFEDGSGRTVDFNLRGDLQEVLDREAPAPVRPGPGRPKLGVVAREVTLLPRHWDWLESQPSGVSAALRRLIDEARKANPGAERRRLACQRADRFLMVMGGDLPGAEEASRALYAGDQAAFETLVHAWPADVREHVRYLAAVAFSPEPQT